MTEYNADTYYVFNRLCPTWIATCGVMTLAEEKGAYWLLDVIASYTISQEVKNADYLKIIKVILNGEGGCTFTIEDEISGVLVTQEIPYTDLDEDVKLWAITDEERTIVLLPSEY